MYLCTYVTIYASMYVCMRITQNLAGKYAGKGVLGTGRLRREDNVKKDIKKVLCEGGFVWLSIL